MITTSRSAVATYQACPRKRYWQYEASNGTPVTGFERKRLTLPLVTGIYVHKGLEAVLSGTSPAQAAAQAKAAYLEEVTARGLQVEEHSDVAQVVDEQAAHVEALVLGWARVRWPIWQEEYEVVEIEVEDRVALSDDVTLAVRADAIVRRKADHRMFLVNFKTVGNADERWLKQWEVDMQLMTELLAAERRHGQEFGGVIIEGLIKGRRVPEKNNVGDVIGYRDTSPLLYGYKCDADPPLVPLQYQSEYTKRKGWYRFATWKENFPNQWRRVEQDQTSSNFYTQGGAATIPHPPMLHAMSNLDYWINWLPAEVVEAQYIVVPPIMRDQERIESKVRQIISIEQAVQDGMEAVNNVRSLPADKRQEILDFTFVQNEHECTYPSRCQMYDACYTRNVSDDMVGSGLYMPRRDHHAIKGGSEE